MCYNPHPTAKGGPSRTCWISHGANQASPTFLFPPLDLIGVLTTPPGKQDNICNRERSRPTVNISRQGKWSHRAPDSPPPHWEAGWPGDINNGEPHRQPGWEASVLQFRDCPLSPRDWVSGQRWQKRPNYSKSLHQQSLSFGKTGDSEHPQPGLKC